MREAKLLVLLLFATSAAAPAAPDAARKVLSEYCTDCHDAAEQKGDIRLDHLDGLALDARLDLLNRVQEQAYLKHMPPPKKRQPSEEERQQLLAWVSAELKVHKASKLEGKLSKPEYGNYVEHEKLFSGEYSNLPGSTPDRRWLISEFIFNAKIQRMLGNITIESWKGGRVPVLGGVKVQNLSLSNPFLLPSVSGVRYYANEDLTGGHLSSMLTNAHKISEYITDTLVKRKGSKSFPAIGQIMALEDLQQATLAARREFLSTRLAGLCEEIYGAKNAAMLPRFQPVVLNEVKKLADGETSKKAPIHVAQNLLKDLEGDTLVFELLGAPESRKKSDEELRELCERTWFYFGDDPRTIQGRMTILRDYFSDFRQLALTAKGKQKAGASKPLPDAETKVIQASILKHRAQSDTYSALLEKCMAGWESECKQARLDAPPTPDSLLGELINQLFSAILDRSPDSAEAREYLDLSRTYIQKLGKLKAIQKLIQTLVLSSEFAYRQEFGCGAADANGRRMLSPRDASYAIAYALTDQCPDPELTQAAASGRLSTREDYKREVTRILADRSKIYLIDPILADKGFRENTTDLPVRKLRFFREFFGYPAAITIFKDEKRFGGDRLSDATDRLLSETDRTVEHILKQDKNVFEELLTTDKFYVYHDGDNARMQAASDRIKSIYAYFKDLDWRKFKKEDLLKHADFLRKVKMRGVDPDKLEARNRQGSTIELFKLSMESITARLDKGQKEAAPFDLYRGYGYDFMMGYNVSKFFNIPMDNWDYLAVQPGKVAHRKGILTHPAWLIAHAKNTETDPVHRGKWVREKLLAGTIPDVPITVDAKIPEDHGKSLRDRLASASEVTYCWKCHVQMNPLGYAFESYDDFGRFRTEEALEYPDQVIKKSPDKWTLLTDTRDVYKTVPVNAAGSLEGTGDEKLDGAIKDAQELAERLGKSRRVRQSIIRYAFRYFMGRNETLSDSQTLIAAEKAYAESGGSFDAVIVSLLTSDSFIYRKPVES